MQPYLHGPKIYERREKEMSTPAEFVGIRFLDPWTAESPFVMFYLVPVFCVT